MMKSLANESLTSVSLLHWSSWELDILSFVANETLRYKNDKKKL